MEQRIEEKTGNAAVDIALDTIRLTKQAIIFNSTKRAAEKCAEDIAKALPKTSAHDLLAHEILDALSRPTKQCERLAYCIRKGVAFHHAGLASRQKTMIEDAFREGRIKIIASTPTLAMGVDLPAYRSVLKDMKRFGDDGMGYVPVLEYLQMAGRAGRPKYDTHGEAIMIASSEAEKDRLFDRYIMGEPEDIYSKLAVEPVMRTYLLSLISAGFISTKKQIMEFFSKTFWAYQYEDMKGIEMIIDRMLELLIGFKFLIMEDFRDAGDTERYAATPLGRRVAELYIDPLTAHNLIQAMNRYPQVYVTPFTTAHMISSTMEMRPLLRVKVKEFADIQETLLKNGGSLVVPEPSAFDIEYEDFLASIKTAQFLIDWMEENDEEYILEKYAVRPGEIRAKLDNADWLLYSCVEIAKLLQFREITRECLKIRMRLEYGVREELLPLLKLKNIGRVRARKLWNNGLKDLGSVKDSDITKLSQILGKAIAADVKNQLGEKHEKVNDNRRKGQMSIGKYGE